MQADADHHPGDQIVVAALARAVRRDRTDGSAGPWAPVRVRARGAAAAAWARLAAGLGLELVVEVGQRGAGAGPLGFHPLELLVEGVQVGLLGSGLVQGADRRDVAGQLADLVDVGPVVGVVAPAGPSGPEGLPGFQVVSRPPRPARRRGG